METSSLRTLNIMPNEIVRSWIQHQVLFSFVLARRVNWVIYREGNIGNLVDNTSTKYFLSKHKKKSLQDFFSTKHVSKNSCYFKLLYVHYLIFFLVYDSRNNWTVLMQEDVVQNSTYLSPSFDFYTSTKCYTSEKFTQGGGERQMANFPG